MARDAYLIEVAWDIVNKFIEDWRRNPYWWNCEADIQAELATRLRQAYQWLGRDKIEYTYPDDPVFGVHKQQVWNRVCCEASVSYKYKDGMTYKCRPDIVVWDDKSDRRDQAIPDQWPILWVCEIKYTPGGAKQENQWDIEKMGYLVRDVSLKQGCWLNFACRAPRSDDKLEWEDEAKTGVWARTIIPIQAEDR